MQASLQKYFSVNNNCMKSVGFAVENARAARGISGFLSEIFKGERFVAACVGTDAVIGDSLGPLVGSLLSERLNGETFVYGTFSAPVTARDVEPLARFLRLAHPDVKVLAIDAAVGREEELGKIKLADEPLQPGLGVEKRLCPLGDASLIGVIAEKSAATRPLGGVRMAEVWKAAAVIADGVRLYFDELCRR